MLTPAPASVAPATFTVATAAALTGLGVTFTEGAGVGAVASRELVAVVGVLLFPATSLAGALKVTVDPERPPASTRVAHAPSPPAGVVTGLVVMVPSPAVTATVEPASAVPLTGTADWLETLTQVGTESVGAAGGVLSTVNVHAESVTCPLASTAWTDAWYVLPASVKAVDGVKTMVLLLSANDLVPATLPPMPFLTEM